MYIYKNLEKYFDNCENCGECCKIPGILLPEQVDVLAEHFELDRNQLFVKYLIAELSAPNDYTAPAFLLSPVKVNQDGIRLPQKIFDLEYVNIRSLNCIFRNTETQTCGINEKKPFGCALLICKKMTKGKPLDLNKSYYHHKWKDSQDIIFSIYPELEDIYKRLLKTVNAMTYSLHERNKIINIEIATVMNGQPVDAMPIYS